jgi:hypothetical protein
MVLLGVRKLVVVSAPAAFIALAEGGYAMTMDPLNISSSRSRMGT